MTKEMRHDSDLLSEYLMQNSELRQTEGEQKEEDICLSAYDQRPVTIQQDRQSQNLSSSNYKKDQKPS